MKNVAAFFARIGILLIVMHATVAAQSTTSGDLCRDVLNLAFYDHAFSLETKKATVAWTAWACQHTQSEAKDAAHLGMDIPIPDADMIIGLQADQSSYKKWTDQHCSSEQHYSDEETMVWQQRDTVSKYMGEAIEAWKSCMKSEDSVEQRRQFSVRLRPASDYTVSGILQVEVHGWKVGTSDPPRMNVIIEGAQCPDNKGWLGSDEVAAGNSFKCTRSITNKACPERSTGRIGFSPLSVRVDYDYSSLIGRLFSSPQRASLSLVPAVEATCQCGGDTGWAPDFSSDSDNCGTCGQSCGHGMNRKCSAGACSVCEFNGPDYLTKPNASQFSCKMRAKASVAVEVKGLVDFIPITGPPNGGDVSEKFVQGHFGFGSTSIPLAHRVPGPGAQNTQTVWNNTSGAVPLGDSGVWNGSLNLDECFWGLQLPCNLHGVEITVREQPK